MQWHKKHSSGSFLFIAQQFNLNGQPFMAPRFVKCSQTNSTPRLESYFCSLLLEFCHHPLKKMWPMSQWWWSRWHSRFTHSATSQKFVGSIPDGDIEIFHLLNPSGRTMTLGSTRPLTEMITRGISRG